jgi:hypothetical protein
VGAVQKLGGVLGDESRLSGRVHQPLEEGALETALQQFAPETAQHGRVEATVFESYPKSVLPSEVETHPLFGLRV